MCDAERNQRKATGCGPNIPILNHVIYRLASLLALGISAFDSRTDAPFGRPYFFVLADQPVSFATTGASSFAIA